MALTSLIILAISIIGYSSIKLSPSEEIRFRRLSAADRSFRVIWLGVWHAFAALVLLYGFSIIVSGLKFLIDGDASFGLLSRNILAENMGLGIHGNLGHLIYAGLVAFTILFSTRLTSASHESRKKSDIENIKSGIDDELELLLVEALELENTVPGSGGENSSELLIRVVLENRKVYIGNLIKSDLSKGSLKNIVIVPLYSGYQSESTLETVITEYYREHYLEIVKQLERASGKVALTKENIEQLMLEYAVTIPAKTIVLAGMFDIAVYQQFLARKLSEAEEAQ